MDPREICLYTYELWRCCFAFSKILPRWKKSLEAVWTKKSSDEFEKCTFCICTTFQISKLQKVNSNLKVKVKSLETNQIIFPNFVDAKTTILKGPHLLKVFRGVYPELLCSNKKNERFIPYLLNWKSCRAHCAGRFTCSRCRVIPKKLYHKRFTSLLARWAVTPSDAALKI